MTNTIKNVDIQLRDNASNRLYPLAHRDSSGNIISTTYLSVTDPRAHIYYGTCGTSAALAIKSVTCNNFTDLTAGASILVTFTYTNTAAVTSLQLDVNSTGAKPIKTFRNGSIQDLPGVGYLAANQTYLFNYDGTNWVTTIDYNTNNQVTQTLVSNSAEYPVLLAPSGQTATTTTTSRFSTALKYNPGTNTLTAGIFNGNATSATKATQDGDGSTISSTYLKLSGGTMTGAINGTYFDASSAAQPASGKLSGLTAGHSRLYGNALYISNPSTNNDQGWIRVTGTAESDTVLEIATGDDGGAGEQIVVRQYNTSNAVARELKLLDTSGNTTVPGTLSAPSGSIWAGTSGSTSAERDLGVRGGAGNIYFYSQASTTGNRGIYLSAHGTDTSGKSILIVDTDNNATFYGDLSGNATSSTKANYADYPSGFSSRSTGVTWGNTTGTSFTAWNEANGGAIDFRYNNPSSGKLSIKVDGRFYFAEGATPAAGLKSANNYWGMTGPDGEDNVWIRTTSSGIIPYQGGSVGSGHGSLGTSTWYFSGAYVDNIYTNSGAAGFKCRNISFGTADPSGGSSGDVYIQYTA